MQSNGTPALRELTIRPSSLHDDASTSTAAFNTSMSRSISETVPNVNSASLSSESDTTCDRDETEIIRASSFLRLPAELHAEISTHLTIPDVLPLLRTCRRAHSLYIRRFTAYIVELAEFIQPSHRWYTIRHAPNLVEYGRVGTLKTFIEACHDEYGHYELEVTSDILEYYSVRSVPPDTEWEDWRLDVWRYLVKARMKYCNLRAMDYRVTKCRALPTPETLFRSLVKRQNIGAMVVCRDARLGNRVVGVDAGGRSRLRGFVGFSLHGAAAKGWIQFCVHYSLNKSLAFFLDVRRQLRQTGGELGPDKLLLHWIAGGRENGEPWADMFWYCLRIFPVYTPAFALPKHFQAPESPNTREDRNISLVIRFLTAKADTLRLLVSTGAPLNTPGAQIAINELYNRSLLSLPHRGSPNHSNDLLLIHHLYIIIRAFLSLGGDPSFIHYAQTLWRHPNAKPEYNILHIAVDPPASPAFTPYEFFDQALATSHPTLVNDPEPLTHLTPLQKAVHLYLTKLTPHLYHPCDKPSPQCLRVRTSNVKEPSFHLHAISELITHGATTHPKIIHLAASYRSKPVLRLLCKDEEEVQKWLNKPRHPRHVWTLLDATEEKRAVKLERKMKMVEEGRKDATEVMLEIMETYYCGVYPQECLIALVRGMRRGDAFSGDVINRRALTKDENEDEERELHSPLAIAAAWGDRRLLSILVTGRCRKRNGRKGNGNWKRRLEARKWVDNDEFFKGRVGMDREAIWMGVRERWEKDWGAQGGGVEEVLYV